MEAKNIFKGVITSKEQQFIDTLYKQANIQQFVSDIKVFNLKYLAAMNETETKMKILNADYNARYNRSPIEHIETRMKTPESLIKKMLRNNIAFDIKEVENNIFDIAGVRIICSFKSDIFELVEMIKSNKGIKVLREKDYVNNPKASGYRSYHLILEVPVYLTTGPELVNVELQIRTMAMDFWASLEHKIKYKYDGVIPDDVKKELIECADSIADSDNKMMNLSKKVKDFNS